MSETGTWTIEESPREFLQDRRALLVLDIFEHVLAAAPLVAELLAAGPALTILVTSRAVLRVSGEHDIAISPMRVPPADSQAGLEAIASFDAIQLFVARAQAAATDFALTDATAPAVAVVCRRLDWLPLAIELAAPRVKHLRLPLLLQRLEQRLPLLIGGPRDQPERLQTMRNAIAWSHDLLTATERALFCRLAVFEGGSTLEAVEAVVGEESVDTLDGITSLTDKSLPRIEDGPDGLPRYLMLETIRGFAREQLSASGEASSTRNRHATWFLQLAEAWPGSSTLACPARDRRRNTDSRSREGTPSLGVSGDGAGASAGG